MQYKRFDCVECEGVFKIKHDQDSDLYSVQFCVFCGAELMDEQDDDIHDEELS